MLFSKFAHYLQDLESLSSRLAMTEKLAQLFQELENDEVAMASYLMQGKLVPKYESLEFQLSVKMVLRALARLQANNASAAKTSNQGTAVNLFGEQQDNNGDLETVTKLYKKVGDLGLVAAEIELQKSDQQLTIIQVYEKLTAIAKESGQGSQERKVTGLVELLEQLDSVSRKFVVRVVIGKLRLGFSTMTMIDALSWATVGDKSERDLIEEAYNKQADVGKLAQLYLSHTVPADRRQALENYSVQVGIPVVPALAQRLNTTEEMIEKMTEVYAEPKYDGLRVQIHVDKRPDCGWELGPAGENGKKTRVRTFTRNLDETSHMFPELAQAVENLNCETCILDAEAIGYDPKTGDLLPFQQTVTRKRKHGIGEQSSKIPLRFFVFDVLELDGRSLLAEPLEKRKEILASIFKNGQTFYQTSYIRTKDPAELRDFHNQQLGDGLEGAVMKRVDAGYYSGRKGWRWVKIKEEEGSRGKLSDTLDCIVMGYYFGRGKRTQFGIGAFLAGVLGEDEQIKTVAKIGTGLTDEQLKEMKQRCDQQAIEQKPKQYDVHKSLVPDVWVEPKIVVEIAADEITRSPVHSAGAALRFPRLVQFRDDKGWEEVTTTNELENI